MPYYTPRVQVERVMCPYNEKWKLDSVPKKDAGGDGKLGIEFVWPNTVKLTRISHKPVQWSGRTEVLAPKE